MSANNDASTCWLPVPGWEGLYEVSNTGHVRSLDRTDSRGVKRTGRILKGGQHSDGYSLARLHDGGRKASFLVHRLVLTVFVGPCPAGMQGCHADGDPTNNHVNNLRWDTIAANVRDKVRHGRHPFAKRTHCPRKHPLAAPNLVASHVREKRRKCLSCARAYGYAKYHQIPLTQELADSFYARLENAA